MKGLNVEVWRITNIIRSEASALYKRSMAIMSRSPILITSVFGAALSVKTQVGTNRPAQKWSARAPRPAPKQVQSTQTWSGKESSKTSLGMVWKAKAPNWFWTSQNENSGNNSGQNFRSELRHPNLIQFL